MNGMMHMAAKGRKGDTMMAHLTPGEVVIPKEVAALRPDLVAHVSNMVANMGGDPRQLVAGAGRKNPATGMEEFATAEEVAAAYQSTLGRAPSAEDQTYWQGAGLGAFAKAAAPELINKTYYDTFGRPAEQSGVDYWLAQGAKDSNFNYKSAITAGAQGADTSARDDIKAGGVDTSKTWSNGASLDKPLSYDAANNTWGKLPVKTAPAPDPAPAPVPGASQTYVPELNRQVVKSQETIEGRIGGLMAADETGNYTNPVIRQAYDRAMQGFARRGLLNSSMAQQAGQEAVIAKAIEIAGPDAKTYFEQSRSNQDARNQFGRDEALQGYTVVNKGIDQANVVTNKGIDQANVLQRDQLSRDFTLRQDYQKSQSTVSTNFQRQIDTINASNATPEDKNIAIAQARSFADGEMVYTNNLYSRMPAWNAQWLASVVKTDDSDIQTATSLSYLQNIVNDPAQSQAVRNLASLRIKALNAEASKAPASTPKTAVQQPKAPDVGGGGAG